MLGPPTPVLTHRTDPPTPPHHPHHPPAESLINVDGWNDVVASARSIMYAMPDPAAVFDVYWFSNDVSGGGARRAG